MSDSWPKLIVDPVHRIISFENEPCNHLILRLINTAEFQRLRRIKQLGVSELVFPGANHSRFSHSLGVVHTARMFLDRVERVRGPLSPDQKTTVLAAALLHDVGHGPFSHTFEKITSEDHEKRTLEIIRDESTEVHKCLIAHDRKLPEQLALFFREDADEKTSTASPVPAFLTQIVSSQLDADRFDYLLRDSHATGAEYGKFDLNWLIQHTYLEEKRQRFFLSRKALMTAEAYVFARYHIYRTVYFHKTTRSAEVMLRLLFRRYKNLIDNSEEKANIVPEAPQAVAKAFTGGMQLADYLLLDDHAITEFLKSCCRSADKILGRLASGLLNRRLYKATDVTEFFQTRPTQVVQFVAAAQEKLRSLGYDPDFDFSEDDPSDTPYKPYDPDSEQPATQIYVEQANGKTVELSKESKPVAQLAERYIFLRYYYPEEVREVVRGVEKDTLEKG